MLAAMRLPRNVRGIPPPPIPSSIIVIEPQVISRKARADEVVDRDHHHDDEQRNAVNDGEANEFGDRGQTRGDTSDDMEKARSK
jgi:hypothetical protein